MGLFDDKGFKSEPLRYEPDPVEFYPRAPVDVSTAPELHRTEAEQRGI